MNNLLTVTPSPHIKSGNSTTRIMLDVVLAMVPALIASVIIFGLRSLLLVAVCVVSCVVFEYLFRVVTKRANTISDLSAVVTGMLLAFNLPVTFPIWMAVLGCFVAIVIVKQLFGGIGQNFANPAITARIVLLVSFAGQMSNWLIPQKTAGGIELVSGATPLTLLAEGTAEGIPSYMDLFLGLRGGCLGETCVLALLIGGVYLVIRKVINPIIPVAFMGTVFLFSWALGADPLMQLLTGGVVLGAVFMATDYSTSPVTNWGKLIFGIGCGLLTVVIRQFGSYPEGVSFAILLMNILTPHIDTLTKTKPFGGVAK